MRFTREQAEIVYAHARAEYPNECCGAIFGPPSAASDGDGKGEGRNEDLRVVPCRNLQDEMHARDPESYPRTARCAYLLDPFEFERLLREAKKRGEVLRGIFHSHPDEDAYFSQEDREAAIPFGDLPSFPEAEHVVVSIRGGEVRDCKSFRWDAARQDFRDVGLEVVEEVAE